MESSRGRQLRVPNEYASSKTLRRGFLFFSITCAVASCGYALAGWNWLEAFYMVTITIFGVGYGEVRPIEEPWLKVFTMGVIFAGCSSLIYVIGGIIQMLTEGEIERMLGTRNRSREIDALCDHTIICGYGRVGRMLAAELGKKEEPFVILDRDPKRVDQAISDGYLACEGDAAEDEALHRAGIYRARTLATVLPKDAINVFITLTARGLSDALQIIARAESPNTEAKLLRSGATSVVMPAAIGAMRIAQLAVTKIGDEKTLPEDRYRMVPQLSDRLQGFSDAPVAASGDNEDREAEEVIGREIAELANLASDLTHSVVNKQKSESDESRQFAERDEGVRPSE